MGRPLAHPVERASHRGQSEEIDDIGISRCSNKKPQKPLSFDTIADTTPYLTETVLFKQKKPKMSNVKWSLKSNPKPSPNLGPNVGVHDKHDASLGTFLLIPLKKTVIYSHTKVKMKN